MTHSRLSQMKHSSVCELSFMELMSVEDVADQSRLCGGLQFKFI